LPPRSGLLPEVSGSPEEALRITSRTTSVTSSGLPDPPIPPSLAFTPLNVKAHANPHPMEYADRRVRLFQRVYRGIRSTPVRSGRRPYDFGRKVSLIALA